MAASCSLACWKVKLSRELLWLLITFGMAYALGVIFPLLSSSESNGKLYPQNVFPVRGGLSVLSWTGDCMIGVKNTSSFSSSVHSEVSGEKSKSLSTGDKTVVAIVSAEKCDFGCGLCNANLGRFGNGLRSL